MKLVNYELNGISRFGVLEGDFVIDPAATVTTLGKGRVRNLLPSILNVPAGLDEELDSAGRAANTLSSGPLPASIPEFFAETGERKRALSQATRAVGRLLALRQSSDAVRGVLSEPVAAPVSSVRLRPPIPAPAKIICVGLNYADHAREQGIEPPSRPIFFLKSINTIIGPGDPIRLPPNSDQNDYEAEFAVVMGKGGRRIPEAEALDYVGGYMVLNDVTARDMQSGDHQWFRGKSCDTFAPIGPYVATPDEVPDPDNLKISCTVNGQVLQDSNTSNLIFKVPYLISYLSQSLTWAPGDILSTGTPPGVGVFRKPPIFLHPGDTVSVMVEGLGTLTNPVVGPE
jgi:acylpyruvate hydrolase